MPEPPIRRALVSVYDKTGLDRLASPLLKRAIEVVSTGGTAKVLRDLGLNVSEAGQLTGVGEILDGRVKTLHPAIHGGILARRDVEHHQKALNAAGIGPIDLVVVNLYPFEATLAGGASFEDTVEMIDVGGPAMIRAAAKNHVHVAVVVDPADYDLVIEAIGRDGSVPGDVRLRLARKAFARTAAYDAAIAAWLGREDEDPFPGRMVIAGTRRLITRYGENPHQRGAFYATGTHGLAGAEQVQGKELSFNNLCDADAALDLVQEFPAPAAVIVKHANPCGAAIAEDPLSAYEKALACDPTSAFGGIVALNRPLDRATAEAIVRIFVEVVVATDADPDACAVLATKPNIRLLTFGAVRPEDPLTFRSISGGFLVQDRDQLAWPQEPPRIVTSRSPDQREVADLEFAWKVAKHVKSNAIVFAKDGATVGIGAGQMSRVDAVMIAVAKARAVATQRGSSALEGSVVASDAFFPFADGLEAALAAGARAVVQPGGSVRDSEVIAAADRMGAAMLFTGQRHFRH